MTAAHAAHAAEVTEYMPKTKPRIVVTASNHEAAQRQYWRHVANRACLAILADMREPVLTARQGSTSPTRGPDAPPRPCIGTDTFKVRAEPIQIEMQGQTIQTDWLEIEMLVRPSNPANILTLAVLRDWTTPETAEPLFKYRSNMKTLARREGLSGDMVYLFEVLLWPHAEELLEALGI